MYFAIILCIAVIGAHAVPVPDGPVYHHIPLLQRTEVHDDFGQFALGYRTGDGTEVREQGILKPTLDGHGYVLVKEGDFSYISPEGITFKTSYVADQHGFRAIGDHLPKSVVA